jgi:hypothetical protein
MSGGEDEKSKKPDYDEVQKGEEQEEKEKKRIKSSDSTKSLTFRAPPLYTIPRKKQ